MKLIVTIIEDNDVDKVMAALTSQNIGVTRVSSTGIFILPGNSTLLIGVDEQHVAQVMQVIADLAARRQGFVAYTYASEAPLAGVTQVEVGGFLSFVLAIDHFEQV